MSLKINVLVNLFSKSSVSFFNSLPRYLFKFITIKHPWPCHDDDVYCYNHKYNKNNKSIEWVVGDQTYISFAFLLHSFIDGMRSETMLCNILVASSSPYPMNVNSDCVAMESITLCPNALFLLSTCSAHSHQYIINNKRTETLGHSTRNSTFDKIITQHIRFRSKKALSLSIVFSISLFLLSNSR